MTDSQLRAASVSEVQANWPPVVLPGCLTIRFPWHSDEDVAAVGGDGTSAALTNGPGCDFAKLCATEDTSDAGADGQERHCKHSASEGNPVDGWTEASARALDCAKAAQACPVLSLFLQVFR